MHIQSIFKTPKAFVFALTIAGVCGSASPTRADDKGDAKTELPALVEKINTKLKAGKTSEKDLADELKEFDDLIARHKDEKTEEVAQIPYMEAKLYLEVFQNSDRATAILKQIQKDFPETGPGKSAERLIAAIARQDEARAVQKSLTIGAKFPDFDVKDISGKPLSVAKFKGKVVFIDFWATWCGPCVGELPNVVKAYEKYHGKGLEIIGISLDSEIGKLVDFTESRKIAWPQYFDATGGDKKLAQRYGIESIPSSFLLDGEGTIIGRNLRGEELGEALEKVLAKK